MKDFSLLRKYVDALYDTALEKGSLKSVDESLRAFTALLSEKPEVVSVLESNASKKAKKEFLSNLSVASDSGINPLFLNMMFLVIDNNRCHFFGKLLSAWEHQVSTKEHVWKAQIYTSVAADDGMKKAIEKYLAECEPGSKFICEYLIDAQLIGGFRIKTKNRIYDDSVAGKLERIRKHILGRARQ